MPDLLPVPGDGDWRIWVVGLKRKTVRQEPMSRATLEISRYSIRVSSGPMLCESYGGPCESLKNGVWMSSRNPTCRVPVALSDIQAARRGDVHR